MKKAMQKLAAFGFAVLAASAAAPSVLAADAGWQRDNTGWRYQDADGGYENDGWAWIGGSWYHFGGDGYMDTGWLRDGGEWYYLTGSGAMATGWAWDGDGWYYLDRSGAMETGWVWDGNGWYYLDGSGRMVSDTLLELADGTYYLDASGRMVTGNYTVDGEAMTFGPDGALVTTGAETPETPSGDEGSGILVVYFSATGNTEEAAGYIADLTGGDLLELAPADPYTGDDLNWNDPDSRVVREYEDESLRDIELTVSTVENWDSYDTVFIGYPIWWGIAAWPVDGFVEANDFTGKTVIPFCTSSSSGMGQSGELLAELAGTGDWQEGHRFSSGVSEADVEEWLSGLDLS